MPTFDVEVRFKNDLKRLNELERTRLTPALLAFRDTILKAEANGGPWPPRFSAALRVKPVSGYAGIWELTWGPDGRCTWAYGDRILPDKVHIIWRRAGGHDIFDDP